MFFSAKPKNFFVDFSGQMVLVARTSTASAPFIIEDIVECPLGEEAAVMAELEAFQIKKSQTGYMHAVCGVHTPKRVVRRVTLETKRLKEPPYLNEVAVQQLRIDPEQYTLAVLNPADGMHYDMGKAAQKEAIFCGLPTDDINAIQRKLLALGIYPERLELSSVASTGALVDYLEFSKIKTPVLMLEIDAEATHCFIVTASGLEASRPILQGLDSMTPVVQQELGLKDEESARKLFVSNAFDFTGMGPILVRKLIKELQSFIGFYEVQTGQSIGQVICTLLPPKLGWIETTISSQLGVSVLKTDIPAWLHSRQITLADSLSVAAQDARRFSLFGLMAQYIPHVVTPEISQ